MFHGRISLNLVLLLLLVNFVNLLRLELMIASLISGQASLISMVCSCLCCYHSLKKFFRLYQQNKSSESKLKFRQASNRCRWVLEAARLVYVSKTNKFITSQNFGSRDSWRIANSVLNRGKSAVPSLFSRLEVLSFASDKAKLLAKN